MINEIAAHIFQVTGKKLIDPTRQSVSGGSINQAFLLSDRSLSFFIKTNTAPRIGMFETEAIALEQIHNTQTIQVPRPICWGTTAGLSYIVLNWLEFGQQSNQSNWGQFGQQLAAMHKVTSSAGFGWEQQNTIGSTPQINDWKANWVDFFIENRLLYQLKLARQKGLRAIISDQELTELIPKFFEYYSPQPSMVHGDLWSGNVGFDRLGVPIIFDPALYFGDREVDLAMTELFGGFPSQFYQSYNQTFPLDSGYKQRKTVYNLYHILNHFNLFGGSYGSTAQQMISEIKQILLK